MPIAPLSFFNILSLVFTTQHLRRDCVLIVLPAPSSMRGNDWSVKSAPDPYRLVKENTENTMQPSAVTNDTMSRHYTAAIAALYAVARASFFLGRLEKTLQVLQWTLHLSEADEVAPKDRLKLALLYGKVLTVDHLLRHGDPTLMFSTIHQAQQLGETTQDQQSLADALSLLAQAHCNATSVALLKRGALPFDTKGEGDYEQALTCQQEALTLQEALQDTRGVSESHFGIGLVYQFWRQHDRARERFTMALQVAEQHGHILEQAEPHRHLTIDALFRGDLDQALLHAQQALAFREAGGFRLYQPLDHLSLRDIYLRKGETTHAQFHLQQASTLAEEMGLATLVSSVINATNRLGAQTEGP
jgi:tetratricopeptide (TPR) repeat protein